MSSNVLHGDDLSQARLDELLELAGQAGEHALTGNYEPIGKAVLAASGELEPAVRQLLASGRVADAMAMITGLHLFWQDSGHPEIGHALAKAALETAEDASRADPTLRARTMLTAGEMAFGRVISKRPRHGAHPPSMPRRRLAIPSPPHWRR